jgi:hypothetical protein
VRYRKKETKKHRERKRRTKNMYVFGEARKKALSLVAARVIW